MVPAEVIQALGVALFPGFLFLIALALFYEWVDRKFVAKLQNRYGPLYTGPKGVLQPLADIIKLLAKEDITPEAADRFAFTVTPIVLLALPLAGLFVVPMVADRSILRFEGDLAFIAFLMALIATFNFLGAWSSTSRYPIVGGVRALVQMVGYEVPLTLVMFGPAIVAGSLSISGIVAWQAERGLYFLLLQPLGFGIFVLCSLAEAEKIPFDIPEAETEIVAGWLTEFTGRKLALLRLAEDLKILLLASLAASLFLGGPSGPWPIPPILWFLIKTTAVVLILSNLRALFARFRIDQMVAGSWKYLTLLAIAQIVGVELMVWLMGW